MTPNPKDFREAAEHWLVHDLLDQEQFHRKKCFACDALMFGDKFCTNFKGEERVEYFAKWFKPKDVSIFIGWFGVGEKSQLARSLALLLCAEILESENG